MEPHDHQSGAEFTDDHASGHAPIEQRADHATPARAGLGPPMTAETRKLCELALECLPLDGLAVLLLGTEGGRKLLMASDSTADELDELQFVVGEGPSMDAFVSRIPVAVPDLQSTEITDRWPGFAREAVEVGAQAMFSYPLHIGAFPFGVVTTYRAEPGPLSDSDHATAIAMVDSLAVTVLDELVGQVSTTTGILADGLGDSVVAQATGMMAVQLNLTISSALVRLRAAAFSQHRPIGEIAEEIVARTATYL